MSEQEKKQILELLGMVIDSIHVITERTSHIKNGDDFLLSVSVRPKPRLKM